MSSVTVSESSLHRPLRSGTFSGTINSKATGKSVYPDHGTYLRSNRRFLIPGRKVNIDLSDHGNSADKTPITLWGEWAGQNQVWRLEPV